MVAMGIVTKVCKKCGGPLNIRSDGSVSSRHLLYSNALRCSPKTCVYNDLLFKVLLKRTGVAPYSYARWPGGGTWARVEGPLIMCKCGLHLTTGKYLCKWAGDNRDVYLVEVKGRSKKDFLEGYDKVCVRQARLSSLLRPETVTAIIEGAKLCV